MKPVYMTTDGKVFDDQAKAEAHEKMAKYYPTILEWAEKEYEGKQGMATRAANIVISWERSRDAIIEKAIAAAKEAEAKAAEAA